MLLFVIVHFHFHSLEFFLVNFVKKLSLWFLFGDFWVQKNLLLPMYAWEPRRSPSKKKKKRLYLYLYNLSPHIGHITASLLDSLISWFPLPFTVGVHMNPSTILEQIENTTNKWQQYICQAMYQIYNIVITLKLACYWYQR